MENSPYLHHTTEKYFITLSFFLSILFNLIPWNLSLNIPDIFALFFLFRGISNSKKNSISQAFIFGILVDVHHHTLFGVNVLRYLIISQLANYIVRRLQEISTILQLVLVFPILVISTFIPSVISYIIHQEKTHLNIFLAPMNTSLIWCLLILIIKNFKKKYKIINNLPNL